MQPKILVKPNSAPRKHVDPKNINYSNMTQKHTRQQTVNCLSLKQQIKQNAKINSYVSINQEPDKMVS